LSVRKAGRLPLEALAPFTLEVSGGRQPPDTDAGERPGQESGGSRPPLATFAWNAVFSNDHPVEIEVGFGKGAFLVAAAVAHPETNYLGIEVDRGLQLYVATRLAKRSLANAKVCCADARQLFENSVAPSSVAAVHVYFPDPWWKKRHKKRRVFTPGFAAAAERALVPGGRLLIATDVEEYFGVMTELVAARPGFCEISRRVETGPPAPDELITNFERKAREKGGPVWRAEYRKVGS
jgi:tRNA (guanine-N7-)-methyltransferase